MFIDHFGIALWGPCRTILILIENQSQLGLTRLPESVILRRYGMVWFC